MKNVTKLAKKSAGLSQKCSICPLMQRCTLEIHRACFDSFVEGFKKGGMSGGGSVLPLVRTHALPFIYLFTP